MEPEPTESQPTDRLPNAWDLLAQYCQMAPEELERCMTQEAITTEDVLPVLRERIEHGD